MHSKAESSKSVLDPSASLNISDQAEVQEFEKQLSQIHSELRAENSTSHSRESNPFKTEDSSPQTLNSKEYTKYLLAGTNLTDKIGRIVEQALENNDSFIESSEFRALSGDKSVVYIPKGRSTNTISATKSTSQDLKGSHPNPFHSESGGPAQALPLSLPTSIHKKENVAESLASVNAKLKSFGFPEISFIPLYSSRVNVEDALCMNVDERCQLFLTVEELISQWCQRGKLIQDFVKESNRSAEKYAEAEKELKKLQTEKSELEFNLQALQTQNVYEETEIGLKMKNSSGTSLASQELIESLQSQNALLSAQLQAEERKAYSLKEKLDRTLEMERARTYRHSSILEKLRSSHGITSSQLITMVGEGCTGNLEEKLLKIIDFYESQKESWRKDPIAAPSPTAQSSLDKKNIHSPEAKKLHLLTTEHSERSQSVFSDASDYVVIDMVPSAGDWGTVNKVSEYEERCSSLHAQILALEKDNLDLTREVSVLRRRPTVEEIVHLKQKLIQTEEQCGNGVSSRKNAATNKQIPQKLTSPQKYDATLTRELIHRDKVLFRNRQSYERNSFYSEEPEPDSVSVKPFENLREIDGLSGQHENPDRLIEKLKKIMNVNDNNRLVTSCRTVAKVVKCVPILEQCLKDIFNIIQVECTRLAPLEKCERVCCKTAPAILKALFEKESYARRTTDTSTTVESSKTFIQRQHAHDHTAANHLAFCLSSEDAVDVCFYLKDLFEVKYLSRQNLVAKLSDVYTNLETKNNCLSAICSICGLNVGTSTPKVIVSYIQNLHHEANSHKGKLSASAADPSELDSLLKVMKQMLTRLTQGLVHNNVGKDHVMSKTSEESAPISSSIHERTKKIINYKAKNHNPRSTSPNAFTDVDVHHGLASPSPTAATSREQDDDELYVIKPARKMTSTILQPTLNFCLSLEETEDLIDKARFLETHFYGLKTVVDELLSLCGKSSLSECAQYIMKLQAAASTI
eukprot:Nk52_evm52s255 gene=Nk52_evmTU52s255